MPIARTKAAGHRLRVPDPAPSPPRASSQARRGQSEAGDQSGPSPSRVPPLFHHLRSLEAFPPRACTKPFWTLLWALGALGSTRRALEATDSVATYSHPENAVTIL